MNINNIPQLSIKNNHLHMDGRDIVEIAGHYGTPLYIGSEQRIEDNVREVQQAFQKYHANTTVHYAAKARNIACDIRDRPYGRRQFRGQFRWGAV